MIISRAYIERFAKYLESVNEAAGREIISQAKRRRFVERLSENPELVRAEVAQMMAEVCGGSGRLASALTCEFYDGIRNAAKLPTKFNATLWEGVNEQTIRAAANAIVDEIIDGRATRPLEDLLKGLATRFNRTTSTATVRHNAMRDPAKPRYAIVPNGDACAFCVMRASRTYRDEPQPESHDHCTCTAVPLFEAKVQGYDQAKYEDMWYEAANAYRSGDISDEMYERIAEQKAEKGAAFDETNAILMVMREQQGIK